jgi:hypothetical protein
MGLASVFLIGSFWDSNSSVSLPVYPPLSRSHCVHLYVVLRGVSMLIR